MGFTAVTNNLILSAAIANEYTGALREREQADGGAAVTPVCTVGQDGQAAALFVSWQQACEDIVDTGVWLESKSYHGEATIPTYTWTTLKTAAGISSGFRRATTMPADWTDYADAAFVDAGYGQAQAGDIRGPWLLADLQAVLKKLVATKPGGRSQFEPEDQCWEGEGGLPTWADAKAAAEADWSSSGGSGALVQSWLEDFGTQKWAWLLKEKQGSQFTGASLWNGVDRACDWYVFTTFWDDPPADVYDANGENVIQDKWALWAGAGDAEGTVDPQSAWCPVADVDDPLPVWPPDPAGMTAYRRGFSATGGFAAVVRWNVTGGFDYV